MKVTSTRARQNGLSLGGGVSGVMSLMIAARLRGPKRIRMGEMKVRGLRRELTAQSL